MPYNTETRKIERGNIERVAPHFYQLGDMKFATLTEIPNEILRDMQSRADFIQHHPFMDEKTKREAIKEIADRGAERAKKWGYFKGDRIFEKPIAPVPPVKAMSTSNPSMDYFQKKAEEFRAGQINMSEYLGCTVPYPPGGILAQIHELDKELKKDEVELMLPKKHKTHITL